MFSSSFTMSEQEHRQWTPYKHDAPGSLCEHDTDLLLSKTVSLARPAARSAYASEESACGPPNSG